jgi:outer membrane lipoprotein carrier protein
LSKMKPNRFPALILVALSFLLTAVSMADETTETDHPAVKRLQDLQRHLGGLTDFRADFTQRLRTPRSSITREEHGVLYVKLPGKMRWNYLEPQRKEFICDGERIWFYEPEEEAATLYAADSIGESDTPLMLLLGRGDLLDVFQVRGDDEFPAVSAKGLVALVHPREEDASFIRAHLEMTASPVPRLVRLVVVDPLGNSTEYLFSDFRENRGLDDDYFLFRPPPGTEIWGEPADSQKDAGGTPAKSN